MHKTHKKVYTQVGIQYIQGNTISMKNNQEENLSKSSLYGGYNKKNTFE